MLEHEVYYTLNSVVSHMWQPKCMWYITEFCSVNKDAWYCRISVACDTMEWHKVQHFNGVTWSIPPALPGRCDIRKRRRTIRLRRWHSTYWHMAQCEGVGWLLGWFALMTKICDIMERNVIIGSEIWTMNIRSLRLHDIGKCLTSWELILRSLRGSPRAQPNPLS